MEPWGSEEDEYVIVSTYDIIEIPVNNAKISGSMRCTGVENRISTLALTMA